MFSKQAISEGRCFIGHDGAPPTGLEYGRVQLYNPVGSGVFVEVHSGKARSDPNGGGWYLYRWDDPLSVSVKTVHCAAVGLANARAELRSDTSTAFPVDAEERELAASGQVGTATDELIKDYGPIWLPPGRGILCHAAATNKHLSFTVAWTEHYLAPKIWKE